MSSRDVTRPRVPAAGEASRSLARARGLAASYGGPPALEEVTFRLRPGDRVAVLGPNGGGKTTLFRVRLGELRPAA
ncbi:MAG: hypothetical protein QOK04_2056, partial [Solirubrobacteraceae bacterium]|nr:hypothetical protein [Solirubrobacteraceae bacterium]